MRLAGFRGGVGFEAIFFYLIATNLTVAVSSLLNLGESVSDLLVAGL